MDLSSLGGIGDGVLCVLMIGPGTATHIREMFRRAEEFANWPGLCPDNGICNLLRMTANALSREYERF